MMLSNNLFLNFLRNIKNISPEILWIGGGIKNHHKRSTIRKVAELRRNIHRIEKGLSARTRRRVFAINYINDTVGHLESVLPITKYSDTTKWATGVLKAYFETVDTTKLMTVKAKFEKLIQQYGLIATPSIYPFKELERPISTISFDELSTLYVQRRSVRYYKNDTVSLSVIQECIQVAAQAPSACNREPFKFHVCVDPMASKRIAECAGGTSGWADQIPSIIVVTSDSRSFTNVYDRHVPYIDASLASMQFLLALQVKGLSSCIINWPNYRASNLKLRHEVKLRDTETVIMLIAVGYADPDGLIPTSPKKNQDNLVEMINDYRN